MVPDKVLELFANTMQALFVVMFFAYCTSPIWMKYLCKSNDIRAIEKCGEGE